MIKCLKCHKEFEPKRETAKFCSNSCRVGYHRKHGKSDKVKPYQMQAIYNAVLGLIEVTKQQSVSLPADFKNVQKIGVLNTDGTIEPLNLTKPKILRSFAYYEATIIECQTMDDYAPLRAEIEAADHLTQREKTILLRKR